MHRLLSEVMPFIQVSPGDIEGCHWEKTRPVEWEAHRHRGLSMTFTGFNLLFGRRRVVEFSMTTGMEPGPTRKSTEIDCPRNRPKVERDAPRGREPPILEGRKQ